MKYIYLGILLLSSSVLANVTHVNFQLPNYYSSDLFYQQLDIDKPMYDDVKALYLTLQQNNQNQSLDKLLSIQYMRSPISQPIITLSAVRHLSVSLLANNNVTPESFEHSVLALYYLERLALVAPDPQWAIDAQRKLARQVNKALSYDSLNVKEDLTSHANFHNAFNKNPDNAVSSGTALVASLIDDPGNIITLTLLTASRLWLGGEASYDDPSTLNYFILTSFYSNRALTMAHKLENHFLADPDNYKPMRLASLLGGWNTLPRRWLAKLHGDKQSQWLIEQEQTHWFNINPGFHSITFASGYFNEPQYFVTGFGYIMQGLNACNQDLTFRSCSDNPRFSFNRLVFISSFIDYAIKAGDFNTANSLLNVKHWPDFHFPQWHIGHSAFAQREHNMVELHERWNNDIRDDDEAFITTTKRQWGDDTMTCQTCHQQQGRTWTKEQEDEAKNPPSSVDVIGQWPSVTTSWTSSVQAFIDCTKTETWNSQVVYQASDRIQFQHALYEAKWWTKSEQPNLSNQFDVWQFIGFCHEGSSQ
ncbi:hypothetical protein HG263_10095 [Pseudoalteromonas sp. JBTF-M23]|uniref:Chitin-binding type-3 domain-containing protein n=1 Tax=Pseudoalteromonas caenipelagi TaxID=2726988 RepID=A0A849VEE6_9GAMM|nr:carbohydrate-binding protein [Pseudoalteromonas caenipelagi]NOU50883.1 hypothetical protein [Pseudoalteromonas caenipelagi]